MNSPSNRNKAAFALGVAWAGVVAIFSACSGGGTSNGAASSDGGASKRDQQRREPPRPGRRRGREHAARLVHESHDPDHLFTHVLGIHSRGARRDVLDPRRDRRREPGDVEPVRPDAGTPPARVVRDQRHPGAGRPHHGRRNRQRRGPGHGHRDRGRRELRHLGAQPHAEHHRRLEHRQRALQRRRGAPPRPPGGLRRGRARSARRRADGGLGEIRRRLRAEGSTANFAGFDGSFGGAAWPACRARRTAAATTRRTAAPRAPTATARPRPMAPTRRSRILRSKREASATPISRTSSGTARSPTAATSIRRCS